MELLSSSSSSSERINSLPHDIIELINEENINNGLGIIISSLLSSCR